MLSGIFVFLGIYSIYYDIVDEKLKSYKRDENYDEVQNAIITYSLGLKRMDKIEYDFWTLYSSNLNVSILYLYVFNNHLYSIQ